MNISYLSKLNSLNTASNATPDMQETLQNPDTSETAKTSNAFIFKATCSVAFDMCTNSFLDW